MSDPRSVDGWSGGRGFLALADPLGHKPVAIRTLPRVGPRWPGRLPWARSTAVRTVSSRLGANWRSPLALRPGLWAIFWRSFGALTQPIHRPQRQTLVPSSPRLSLRPHALSPTIPPDRDGATKQRPASATTNEQAFQAAGTL